MSYLKVKSIRRYSEDGKIIITTAFNNISPVSYTKWSWGDTAGDMTYNDKLMTLIRAINDGGLRLNNNMYDWNYALFKTNKEMIEKYGNSYDLYDLTKIDYNNRNEQKELQAKKYLEEYCNVFLKYLDEKIAGQYYLYNNDYGYIKPKGNNGAFYYNNCCLEKSYLMDYKEAYCKARNIDKDIEIKQY